MEVGGLVHNEEFSVEADPVQIDIVKTTNMEVLPLSEDYGGNIQFDIKNNRDLHYIDLASIELEVEFDIQKVADDAKIASTVETVGPTNNILHTAFSNIGVTLNNYTITDTDRTYPFAAYLAKLTSYDRDHLDKSQGRLYGWHTDKPGDMDNCDVKRHKDPVKANVYVAAETGGTVNKELNVITEWGQEANPLGVRNGWFFKGTNYKTLRLKDRFMCIPFNQPRFLPFGVNMFITLERSPKSFSLMQKDGTADNYYLAIHKAKLHVPYVEIREQKFRKLETQKVQIERKFPLNRMVVFSRPIPAQTTHAYITNMFQGKPLPKRMLVGFVKNSAEAGEYDENPFNFGHHDIESFQVFKNGEAFPTFPYKLNFDDGKYMDLYAALFNTTGQRWENIGTVIDYDAFGKGFTLFPFDLTGDRKGSENDVDHVAEFGQIIFDFKFKTGSVPTDVLSMIVAAEYEDTMLIDGYGNVRCTWKR